jgi:hypothetical protein
LLRGLLLLLACLIAALPVGMCLCGHAHSPGAKCHHHDETPTPSDDECHCDDSPRVATVPSAPSLETDNKLSFPPRPADLTSARPQVVHPAFRSESPPGRPSLPLYLSVGRLLI